MNNSYINYTHSYLPSKFAEDNLIVCDTMGCISYFAFHYNRKTFNNNVVIYVLEGTFYVKQYGKKYILKKNQGILIHLNDAHEYYSDREDVATFVFFHFKGNITYSIMTQLKEYHYLPLVFNYDKTEEIAYECFEITMSKQPTFEYDLSICLFRAIVEITKEPLLTIEKELSSVKTTWFADRIIKYVDDNVYSKISLEELANHANMSRFHFCRVFSDYFNTTPLKYVTKVKINKSKILLRNTKLKLSIIANDLGFSDQSHFSKTFKSIVGTTPLHYRKTVEHIYLFSDNSQK